jgi:hypothetical protein
LVTSDPIGDDTIGKIGNNRKLSETIGNNDEHTVDGKKIDRKGYAKGNYDQQLIQIL